MYCRPCCFTSHDGHIVLFQSVARLGEGFCTKHLLHHGDSLQLLPLHHHRWVRPRTGHLSDVYLNHRLCHELLVTSSGNSLNYLFLVSGVIVYHWCFTHMYIVTGIVFSESVESVRKYNIYVHFLHSH